jgi:hypothetical protein
MRTRKIAGTRRMTVREDAGGKLKTKKGMTVREEARGDGNSKMRRRMIVRESAGPSMVIMTTSTEVTR